MVDLTHTDSQENKLINLDFLSTIALQKKEIKLQVLNLFLTEVPQDLSIMNKAVEEGDYAKIKKCAHKLTSTTTVIKIKDLDAVLGKIETLGKLEKNIESIRQFNQLLNDKFKQAMDEVNIEKLKYI